MPKSLHRESLNFSLSPLPFAQLLQEVYDTFSLTQVQRMLEMSTPNS